MKKSLAWTVLTAVGVMALNLITGIVVARLLAADGRGELAAIQVWAQILSWLCLLGFGEAAIYMQSSAPEDGDRLFSTSLIVSFVLATAGTLIAEAVLPIAFHAQTGSFVRLGQLYMPTIYVSCFATVVGCLTSADQNFFLANVCRFLQPLLYSTLVVACYFAHQVSVGNILIAAVVSSGLTALVNFAYLIKRFKFGKPSVAIAKKGLLYGLRLQGSTWGNLANARLDIMMMPGFLSPTQIGYYSIATNLSSLISSLMNSVSLVLFPMATRAGEQGGTRIITKVSRFAFFTGWAIAIAIYVSCPYLIHLVYGERFAPSVIPLRILLPGAVMFGVAAILSYGLQSLNRPEHASLAHIVGFVVTVAGLAISLRTFGIIGAAVTSTVSYSVSCIVAALLLKKQNRFSISQALSLKTYLADLRSL